MLNHQPMICLDGKGLIYPNTIGVIKGSDGSHKSRLAGQMASAVISRSGIISQGFECKHRDIQVVYFDTERNMNYEFPMAISRILRDAKCKVTSNPNNFRYSSLVSVPREHRANTVRRYLGNLRKRNKKHILIILDVVSDLVQDFNNVSNSLDFIDLCNALINEFECTCFVVIHQNPRSNKERGHLGSELRNKASTVLQTECDEGIVTLTIEKSRHSGPCVVGSFRFDENKLDLVRIQNPHGFTSRQLDKSVKLQEKICTILIGRDMCRQDLIDALKLAFGWSEAEIGSKLAKFKNGYISDGSGNSFKLRCFRRPPDKKDYYELI